MAFRNALARLRAGGATVDTVLDLPEATPGGALSGTVHLTGGRVAQDVTEGPTGAAGCSGRAATPWAGCA